MMPGVDTAGLDEMDRKILDILIRFYDGGPAGVGHPAQVCDDGQCRTPA